MEPDVDRRAVELSNLLRTIAAALPLYPVGLLDVDKKAGELFAECPFHFLVVKQSPTDSTTRQEMSLYVNLREGSWRFIRCRASGDATQFGYLMDAIGAGGTRQQLGNAWQLAMMTLWVGLRGDKPKMRRIKARQPRRYHSKSSRPGVVPSSPSEPTRLSQRSRKTALPIGRRQCVELIAWR